IKRINIDAKSHFSDIRLHIASLVALVPAEQYYRYCGMWSFSLQQSVFLASWIHYLDSETLISTTDLEKELGVIVSLKGDDSDFHLNVEDLLHGYVSITSEL
ncbi:hypothetical protein HK096_000512, partial [Nowakowskiella sp. JEL0078]